MQFSITHELKHKLRSRAVVPIFIALMIIPFSVYLLVVWSGNMNGFIQSMQYIAEVHSDSTLLELTDSARWEYIFWPTAGIAILVIVSLLLLYASLLIFDVVSFYRDKIIWKSNQATLIELRHLEKLIIQSVGGQARYTIYIGIPVIIVMPVGALFFLFTDFSILVTLILPACLGILGTAILAFTHSRRIAVKQNLSSQTIRTIIRLEAQTFGIAVITFLLIVFFLLIVISIFASTVVTRFIVYGINAWTPVINQASAYLEPTQIQSIQQYIDSLGGPMISAPITTSELGASGITLFIWFCVAVLVVFFISFPFIYQDLRFYKSRRWQIVSGAITAILMFFGIQLIAHLLQKDLVFLPPFLASLVAAIYITALIQYFKNLPYPRVSFETQLCTNLECHYENRLDAEYCGGCGAYLKSNSAVKIARNDGK